MSVLHRFSGWASANKLKFGGLILAVMIVQGAAAFTTLQKTTEVTAASAQQRFEAAKQQAQQQAEQSGAQPTGAEGQPTEQAPPITQPASTKTNAPTASGPGSGAPECEWVCTSVYAPPKEGVYQYYQCGRTSGRCSGAADEPEASETLGGTVTRKFPRTGQRYITHLGPRKWRNVHLYAEEHEEEFHLSVDEAGLYAHTYIVRLKVAGREEGSNIRQEPPMVFARFPQTVGQTWSGSWKDPNGEGDGRYTGKIIGKEEWPLGGKTYRIWVTQMDLELLGPKVTGKVRLILWMSPELRNTVQEFYDQDLVSEGVSYRGLWMATLRG